MTRKRVTLDEEKSVLGQLPPEFVIGVTRLPRFTTGTIEEKTGISSDRIKSIMQKLKASYTGNPVSIIYDQLTAPPSFSERLDSVNALGSQVTDAWNSYQNLSSQLQLRSAELSEEVFAQLTSQNKYLKSVFAIVHGKKNVDFQQVSVEDIDEQIAYLTTLRDLKTNTLPSLDMYVQSIGEPGFSLLMPFTKEETVRSNGSLLNGFYEGLITDIHEVMACTDCTKAAWSRGFLDLHIRTSIPYHEKRNELESMLNEVQFLPPSLPHIPVRLQGNGTYRLLK